MEFRETPRTFFLGGVSCGEYLDFYVKYITLVFQSKLDQHLTTHTGHRDVYLASGIYMKIIFTQFARGRGWQYCNFGLIGQIQIRQKFSNSGCFHSQYLNATVVSKNARTIDPPSMLLMNFFSRTVCSGSSDPFYIVTYYIK